MYDDEHINTMLRFQNGDEVAFDTLVEAYKRQVMAVAFRFLQNAADAEEATQETFIKVYKARKKYKPGHKFSSWLFTIVNHTCLNMLRYRKRHGTTSLDQELNADGFTLEDQLSDPNAQPADAGIEIDEAQQTVRKAVSELGEEERIAVILDHWEHQSLKEISDVLKKSVPAVKSILFRARAKLRIKLQAYLHQGKVG